jgi:formate hydrogenlyase subunit 3/multisubunit Na+/H+ antiporter MnhD subunit
MCPSSGETAIFLRHLVFFMSVWMTVWYAGWNSYYYIVLYLRSIGLLSFYIFFESRLIPALFLILSLGYQPERGHVGIYFSFYTLLASLPLLVGILFVYISLGSLCLFLLCGIISLVAYQTVIHTK